MALSAVKGVWATTLPAKMLARKMAAAETNRLVKSNFAPWLRSFHCHEKRGPFCRLPPTGVRGSLSVPQEEQFGETASVHFTLTEITENSTFGVGKAWYNPSAEGQLNPHLAVADAEARPNSSAARQIRAYEP
jgi:hypothetical protein